MICNDKKHPCPDCSYCQWCSDDRCRLCLGKGCNKRKLSQDEQIARYDQLNLTESLPKLPFTADTLHSFDLIIRQPVSGYRFSLDPLLLCAFAGVRPEERVVDLGTGCGVMPLVLVRQEPTLTIVGVEVQTELALLARRNVTSNGLEFRITVETGDILQVRQQHLVSTFDLVVSNPPYRKPGTGKVSPRVGRDLARHESTAGLPDFLSAAKYLVKPAGRICFVYHPERLAEFLATAHGLNLAPTRLRFVHGTEVAEARIFLIELVKGRRGTLKVEPPLVVYDKYGKYSSELAWLEKELL